MQQTEQVGVCDVHKYALDDTTQRIVNYCGLCDAWICTECWGNYPLRARAMVIRGTKSAIDKVNSWFR